MAQAGGHVLTRGGTCTVEIAEHIHTNQFDEITTTYKLMLKERERYITPAMGQQVLPVIPATSTHHDDAGTGAMVTVTISEAAAEDPASTLPPTPLLADLLPSSDEEDGYDHGPGEADNTVRAVLSPPQSRGRRALAIRIPRDPSADGT
jgi:hypothetical protein